MSVSPQPAYLANGAYTLSEPLQVEFSKAAWTGPVSGDPVTITFRQHDRRDAAVAHRQLQQDADVHALDDEPVSASAPAAASSRPAPWSTMPP